jgi:LuxR family quorum-sensing system transcriptional regulator CciR
MPGLEEVQAFIDCSRRVASAEDLHDLMRSISRDMGFDHFALVHHVDLRPWARFANHLVGNDFIVLSDYPQFWVDQYISDGIVADDPVLIASQRTNVGFAWDTVPDLLKLTPLQRDITERTHRAGLVNGFTVPANVPGELNGSCNFAIAAGRDLPRQNLAMAQLIGSFAFQAARELVARQRKIEIPEPPRLSQRQLECIVLVARGKSDWEIGKILGISEETVKWHLKDARARYDVSKRVQLVTRTLFDGQVALTELLN